MKKILASLITGLLIYEGFALTNQQSGDTISEIIWTLSDKWPIVAVAFGLLMGHFFWARTK